MLFITMFCLSQSAKDKGWSVYTKFDAAQIFIALSNMFSGTITRIAILITMR